MNAAPSPEQMGYTLLTVLLLLAACSSPEGAASLPPGETAAPASTATPSTRPPSPTEPPPTQAAPPEAVETAPPAADVLAGWPGIRLVETISGLDAPVDFAHAADGSGRVYVVEQKGVVQVFSEGVMREPPLLDIRDRVACCGEKGLLGIAFPSDFAGSRLFYVNYTTTIPGSLHTRVSRFRLREGTDQADPASEEIILQFHQPWGNHNGGQIAFGPQGNLWVGTGDGGSGGDPQDNGQKGGTLLGKLLRIDVTSPTDELYVIPEDNPFVGNSDFLDEIWAYGLRNPWRFSFDRATGDLYVADVGQNRWEEVSFQPASSRGGENYGWRTTEGFHCFNPQANCVTSGLTLPVAEYGRDSGGSITGGYVYRGARQPSLQGIYFFADFVSGRIWGLRRLNDHWEAELLLESSRNVSSFGEDEEGNLYVVDYRGDVLQIQAAGGE